MSYKQKYQKYKLKYLSLKYQKGGNGIEYVKYNSDKHLKNVIKLDMEVFKEQYEKGIFKKKETEKEYLKYNGHVAFLNDKIVGFILYNMDPQYKNPEYQTNTWYFSGFGVSPDHQGKGIGKQLLNLMIADAGNNITLITRPLGDQEYLVKMYEKVGFKLVPDTKNKLGSSLMIRKAHK